MYDMEEEIKEFFKQKSATHDDCDSRAKELVGGDVKAVSIQGSCSYSVYAGPNLEFVVQFRPKSLRLDAGTAALASEVYASWVPAVSFKGEMGDDLSDKETVCVYVQNRVMGTPHLDFVLEHGCFEKPQESSSRRQRLMGDIARELQMLFRALPDRLHPSIQQCIDSLDGIFSLPMVLLHKDFGQSNIMVDDACNLTGVIDWAETEICPFGLNIHSLQAITGHLSLRSGWKRSEDYDAAQTTFWSTFRDEVGRLSDACINLIRIARNMGLLLSRGFANRLANRPEPVAIGDDELGRYNMLSLDGFLISLETKFENIDSEEK